MKIVTYFKNGSARRKLKREKMPEWRAAEWYVEKRIFTAIILLLFAVIIPVLATQGYLLPTSSSIPSWFQRSGAIIVLLGATVEILIYRLPDCIHGDGNHPDYPPAFDDGGMHEKIYHLVKVIGIIVVIFGTIICGYGDLILKSIINIAT